MPAIRQGSMNPTLTNYARGLFGDVRSALADFIAPIVRVTSMTGQYKEFNDKDAFVSYETERAISGQATRIIFKSDDPTFVLKPNAIEVPIDWAERDYTADQELGIKQARIRVALNIARKSHERKVVDLVTGVTAEAGLGKWSDPAVDPIDELDSLIERIATQTDIMPNALAFGLPAWRKLRSHPKVIARQPGAAVVGASAAQIAGMLLNPGIEIRVGIMGKDLAKQGNAKNATNMIGANALVFIRDENASEADASFAKTFMAEEGGIDSVWEYEENSCRSTMLAVDWAAVVKKTSAVCGARLAIT